MKTLSPTAPRHGHDGWDLVEYRFSVERGEHVLIYERGAQQEVVVRLDARRPGMFGEE